MLSRLWRRRRIQRLRRQVRPCRDLGNECAMQVERALVHHGLDGRVFEVRRLWCTRCGRQVVTAREQTGPDGVEANF